MFRFLAFSLAHQFIDLPVDDISAPPNAEKDEQSDENAPSAEPFIDGPTDEKAEGDASGHREADLHHDGGIFSPIPVLAIIEKFFSSRFQPPVRTAEGPSSLRVSILAKIEKRYLKNNLNI